LDGILQQADAAGYADRRPVSRYEIAPGPLPLKKPPPRRLFTGKKNPPCRRLFACKKSPPPEDFTGKYSPGGECIILPI